MADVDKTKKRLEEVSYILMLSQTIICTIPLQLGLVMPTKSKVKKDESSPPNDTVNSSHLEAADVKTEHSDTPVPMTRQRARILKVCAI